MLHPTLFYFVCFIFICLHKSMASLQPFPTRAGRTSCVLAALWMNTRNQREYKEVDELCELISDQTLNLIASFLALNIYFNSEAQPSTFDARNILTHSEKVLSSTSKNVRRRVKPGSWLVPGKVHPMFGMSACCAGS